MVMAAVEVNRIARSYGKTEALHGVSFEVQTGELFGLIGPDGAGKTTLLRILATLLLADRGEARIAGFDVVREYREIRRRIGYMPGRFSLYQDLTVEENLNFFATVFRTTVEENYHLVRDIYRQLEPFKRRRAGALSGGMKQKLALCCALIHQPQVLLLDEPTTGVDPVSRKEFWEMLHRLKEQRITILVSTPYMDEASRCDRIALINDGRFLTLDTPQAIVRAQTDTLWAVEGEQMPRLLKALRRVPEVKSAFAFGDVHHVTVTEGFTIGQLGQALAREGFGEVVIRPIVPNIEDAYMNLAKK